LSCLLPARRRSRSLGGPQPRNPCFVIIVRPGPAGGSALGPESGPGRPSPAPRAPRPAQRDDPRRPVLRFKSRLGSSGHGHPATLDGTNHPGVLPHGLGAVRAGLAAEPAVHRHAEAGQVARTPWRACAVAPRAPSIGSTMPQEDAGVARLQVGQRAEEAAVLAAQVPWPSQVQPVHGAARSSATAKFAMRTSRAISRASYIGHSGNVP